jgi:hypothetical protein
MINQGQTSYETIAIYWCCLILEDWYEEDTNHVQPDPDSQPRHCIG